MAKEPTQPLGFGTRAIRAASTPPEVRQVANSVPIYQAATFAAEDSAELGDILSDRKPGYAYARIDNPTASAMASAVAELEGAEAGYSFASGMAAIHGTLFALVRAGDRIVSTRAVYGSTRTADDQGPGALRGGDGLRGSRPIRTPWRPRCRAPGCSTWRPSPTPRSSSPTSRSCPSELTGTG